MQTQLNIQFPVFYHRKSGVVADSIHIARLDATKQFRKGKGKDNRSIAISN